MPEKIIEEICQADHPENLRETLREMHDELQVNGKFRKKYRQRMHLCFNTLYIALGKMAKMKRE